MNLFEYFRVFPIIIYTQLVYVGMVLLNPNRERERGGEGGRESVYPFRIIYSSLNQGTEMKKK